MKRVRPLASTTMFPKNIIQLSGPQCFICGEEIIGRGVPLLVGQTPFSKTGLPAKIGQLMGDGFMVVVSVEDMLCKRCAVLLNHLDKLEADLSVVRKALIGYLQVKYQLGNELELAETDAVYQEDVIIQDADPDSADQLAIVTQGIYQQQEEYHDSDSDLETAVLGGINSKKVNVEIIMDENRPAKTVQQRSSLPYTVEPKGGAKFRRHKGELKTYQCMTCNFKVYNLNVFQAHIKTCSASLPFKCSMCEQKFESHKNIRRHIMEAHLSKWTCHFCNATFNKEDEFTSHMKTHLSMQAHSPVQEEEVIVVPSDSQVESEKDYCMKNVVGNYECTLCHYETSNKKTFQEHIRRHVSNTQEKCKICKQVFEEEGLLTEHMKSHHTVIFKCGVCSKDFVKKEDMVIHVRTHKCDEKQVDTEVQLDEEIEEMEISDHEEFDNPRRSEDESTMSDSGGSKNITGCEVLEGVRAASEAGSDGKSSTHTKEIEFHSCSICSLTFVNEVLFVQHMDMHKKKKELSESVLIGSENMVVISDGEMMIPENVLSSLPSTEEYVVLNESLEDMFEKMHSETADSHKYSEKDTGSDLKCHTCNAEFSDISDLELHKMTQGHQTKVGIKTKRAVVSSESSHLQNKSTSNDVEIPPDGLMECRELVITEDGSTALVEETSFELADMCEVRIKTENVESLSAGDEYDCNQQSQVRSVEVGSALASESTGEPTKKTYVCAMCYYRSPSIEELRHHFKEHKGDKCFDCNVCGQDFFSEDALNNHLKQHDKYGKKLTCPYCLEEMGSRIALQAHLIEKHQKDKIMYRCQYCEEEFATKKAYKTHEETHPERYAFKCDECDQQFLKEKQLMDHKDLTHRDPHCRFCGKEILKAKTLKNHELRHMRDKDNFECDVCKRVFKTKTGLRHHVAVHTGEYKYCCDYCGRGFMSRMMMEEHRSMHTKEERYVCDVCGRKFSFQSTYWIHRKWHDNPYPYKCSFCGRMFRHSSLLAVHKRKHTGERPYKCPQCPLTFPVGGTLKRHLILHTGVYPFNCDTCKRGFTTRHKYATHLAKIHGDFDLLNAKQPQGEFKMVVRDEKKDAEQSNALWEVSSDTQSQQMNFKLEALVPDDATDKDSTSEGISCTVVSDDMLVNNMVPTRVVEIVLDEASQAVATVRLEDHSNILPELWYE